LKSSTETLPVQVNFLYQVFAIYSLCSATAFKYRLGRKVCRNNGMSFKKADWKKRNFVEGINF